MAVSAAGCAGLHLALVPQGFGAVSYTHLNKATGNYTVKATFKEPKYMNLNSHPHPYGLVIAGNDLGTAQQDVYKRQRYAR